VDYLRRLVNSGKFEEIAKLSKEYLNSYPESPDAQKYASYLIYSLYKLGKYSESQNLGKFYLNGKINKTQAYILDNLGLVQWKKGNLILAEKYIVEAMEIYVEIADEEGQGIVYNDLAIINIDSGLLSDAVVNIEKSIQILDRLNIKHQIAFPYANLGKIYQMQGKLEKSFECLRIAESIFTELNDSVSLGVVFKSYGRVYQSMGEYKNAEKYLMSSYLIRKGLNHPIDLAESLYHLIEVMCKIGSEDTLTYLRELEQLSLDTGELRVYQYWQMAKGKINVNQKRVFARFQAKNNFQQIISDENSVVELKTEALIEVIHLLFLELQLSDVPMAILEEIEENIEQLSQYAKKEHSLSLEVNMNIILARLCFLQQRFEKSRVYLKIAEKLANKGEIQRIKTKVKNELTLLDENFEYWQTALAQNPNIKNMVEKNEIVDYLKKIAKLDLR